MDSSVLLFAFATLSVTLGALAIALVRRSMRRTGVWVSALLLFVVHFWVYFGLVPTLQLATEVYGPYHVVDPTNGFTRAWFAAVVFLWATLVGYVVVPRSHSRHPRSKRPQPLPTWAYLLISGLLGAVYLISFFRFFDQGVAYYLANLSNRIQLAFGKGYWLLGMTVSISAALYFVDRIIAGSRCRQD